MEHEAVPGSHRARLNALEEGQRNHGQRAEELAVSMTGMTTTMQQGFERLERMMLAHDGERRDRRSSASRGNRSRAEEREGFGGGSDASRARQAKGRQLEGRQLGGRIEGGGIEVERWLERADHSRTSNPRRDHDDWGYHDEDSEASDGG